MDVNRRDFLRGAARDALVGERTDKAEHLRKAAMAVHGQFNNNSNVSGWGRYELGL